MAAPSRMVLVPAVILSLLASACGSSTPTPSPAANSSSPSASAGSSPSELPSAAPASAAPSPVSPSPAPTQQLAVVVAESRLVVRTLPGTDQQSAILPERLNPGQQVVVEGGPVDASGYPWYWIRFGNVDGWVAARSRTGEQWLAIAAQVPDSAGGWTTARPLGKAGCASGVIARIDQSGHDQVVTTCQDKIQISSNASGSWSTITYNAPTSESDEGLQVALDGRRLYVAFTRTNPLACGIEYLGVYYSWRYLANGTWSVPKRLGPAGDVLQSFQVVAGKLHLTVVGGVYETDVSGTLRRYPLAGAGDDSSLRVASDGRARIVYETAKGLRYAVFRRSGFQTSLIPGTSAADTSPTLVLDGQDNAHVTWQHNAEWQGCGERPATSEDGTYYATNKTGTWTPAGSRRITTAIGAAVLALDSKSGRVHVLLVRTVGVKYYTMTAPGQWSGQLISPMRSTSAALLVHPSSGELLAVYVGEVDVGQEGGTDVRLYYLTKP
jgi:hypothetical protein